MNKHNHLKIVCLFVITWLTSVTATGICSADFSYSIRNPKNNSATWYVVSKTNISSRTEGDFIYLCPSSGGATLETSSPGVIVYHFSFEETITEATLSIRTSTFHWAYSRGHSFVYAATDGYNWMKLAEAPPPDYGGWSAGNFSGSLPQAFIGKKDIYVKVELYSYGKSASKGGIYCNTAQHLRYDSKQDNVTFNLEVKTSTLPIAKILPLPTDKTCFPHYSPIVLAEAGINPPACKPIGVGDIAEDRDTVDINIKLENPSGPYDAYLALNAPDLDPNEYFLLGQDGTFYPFSQSGLVKWKLSATGKIDEKPFGDFPVSLLPGGAYNFNFILTPAGSLEAYYLWQTSFFAPETSITVPDGSAGFFNGTLVVPNATIIYQGQTYEESAPLAEDRIVGIKKDGQTYLYHPAMGVAKLSEYNSRRAVGFFMLGVSASEAEAMRAQRTQTTDSAKKKLQPTSPTIGIGQTVQLGTGINVELLDNNGMVKAVNKARRFSVVKTDINKYYLTPRSNLVPSEIVPIVKRVFDMAGDLLADHLPYTFSERSDIEAIDKVESFSAFIRALPVYAYSKGEWSKNQKEAFEKDKKLTVMVNTIDFIYCLLDMCKSIAGILPSDCADLLISSGLFKGLQSVMASVIEDPGLITQINSDTEKSILSDFAGCICSLSSIHTFETVNEALDFASAFNWVVEDIAWNNFIAYIGRDFDAYDDILLEPKNTVIGSWYWCDDANCSQAYEPGEGRQNMILYGPEKNYKASVDGFGDGTWTMEGGSTVTIVVTNIDDRTYTFEGKAVDGCQRIIDGRYIETSNFPIDIINHCWFAQKYK